MRVVVICLLLVLLMSCGNRGGGNQYASGVGAYVNGQKVVTKVPSTPRNSDDEKCLTPGGCQGWAEKAFIRGEISATLNHAQNTVTVAFVGKRTNFQIDQAITQRKNRITVKYSIWRSVDGHLRKKFGQAEGRFIRLKLNVDGEPCYGVIAKISIPKGAKWLAVDDPLDPG